MGKKKDRTKKGKTKKPYSTLEQHRRLGAQLIPPLATLPNLSHASWINDRLPELLWCALLIVHLGQHRGLELCKRAIVAAKPLLDGEKGPFDVGLTGLAALPESARRAFLDAITRDPDAQAVLKALLLFPMLPARDLWLQYLPGSLDGDWNTLAVAVARVLDHQSQEATDCRWVRVIFRGVTGYLILPAGADEMQKELLEYPNYGDQRKVRPTIRSMELAFCAGSDTPALTWPSSFWEYAWRSTPCNPTQLYPPEVPPLAGATLAAVAQAAAALGAHYAATTTGTRTGAKHDTIFGLAAYSVSVLGELLRLGNATSLLARTGVRAILEAHITLAYLLEKDESDLWVTFRAYGAGQAKLAFLKLDATEANRAGLVSSELLQMIATEDQSLEFLPVVLGHWDETNLRKMADEADVKDLYDDYYSWTSAFVHGNWAALRAAVFDICLNPLHRLHRVLRSTSTLQTDVVVDAGRLVDRTLELVNIAYPTFTQRVL